MDTVKDAIERIAETLRNTHASSEKEGPAINSMVQLLKIEPATTSVPSQELTLETSAILNTLRDPSDRFADLDLLVRSLPAAVTAFPTVGSTYVAAYDPNISRASLIVTQPGSWRTVNPLVPSLTAHNLTDGTPSG